MKEQPKTVSVGLDIHGVSTANPEFFSKLTESLSIVNKDNYYADINWAIHILTGGSLINGEIASWLKEKNIYYTHIFSISDYLRKTGCKELEGSTLDNPWFSEEEWNKCKANYCRRNKIDLHLDDDDRYLEHFSTPIARYYSKDPNEVKRHEN